MKVVLLTEVEALKTPFEDIVMGQAFWIDEGPKTPARIRVKLLNESAYAPVYSSTAPATTYTGKSFELVPKGTKIILEVD